jgi:DNA-binding response OmpR family regulator
VETVAHNETILVVEDDSGVREMLTVALQDRGYRVLTAVDGPSALALIATAEPDLILLDLVLPGDASGLVGLDVCRKTRQVSDVPIIMVTALDKVDERVQGLDLGADDYVVKPFHLEELLARVRSQLRRSAPASEPTPTRPQRIVGALTLDPDQVRVLIHGHPVSLTPVEFEILYGLAERVGQVVSREQLAHRLWSDRETVRARSIDVEIYRLRLKIEDDPQHPTRLLTVRHVGYKLVVPERD